MKWNETPEKMTHLKEAENKSSIQNLSLGDRSKTSNVQAFNLILHICLISI